MEFAVVSPILFLMLFGCFTFTRSMLLNSFVEESAFRAARRVAVPGATIEEGIAIVNEELATLGITNPTVLVEPLANGVVQSEIDDTTERVAVTVTAELSHGLNSVIGNMILSKRAEIKTERIRYALPTGEQNDD